MKFGPGETGPQARRGFQEGIREVSGRAEGRKGWREPFAAATAARAFLQRAVVSYSALPLPPSP